MLAGVLTTNMIGWSTIFFVSAGVPVEAAQEPRRQKQRVSDQPGSLHRSSDAARKMPNARVCPQLQQLRPSYSYSQATLAAHTNL